MVIPDVVSALDQLEIAAAKGWRPTSAEDALAGRLLTVFESSGVHMQTPGRYASTVDRAEALGRCAVALTARLHIPLASLSPPMLELCRALGHALEHYQSFIDGDYAHMRRKYRAVHASVLIEDLAPAEQAVVAAARTLRMITTPLP